MSLNADPKAPGQTICVWDRGFFSYEEASLGEAGGWPEA